MLIAQGTAEKDVSTLLHFLHAKNLSLFFVTRPSENSCQTRTLHADAVRCHKGAHVISHPGTDFHAGTPGIIVSHCSGNGRTL